MIKSVDSKEAIISDKKIILRKNFLYKVYYEFYQRFQISNIPGPVVELGSGGGFLKSIYPNVITSDVVTGPNIDKVFSGTKIPFKDNSIGGFVMLNTFHHIKNVEISLQEMERCLKPRGKIVMIEPNNSWLARIYYENFHSEGFDRTADWKIKGKGRMSDANNALPWIVFTRDQKIFTKKFPNLRILKIEPHTPLKFVFSGGLSKHQLVPTFLYPLITLVEKIISPLNNYLAFFVTIELQKNDKNK